MSYWCWECMLWVDESHEDVHARLDAHAEGAGEEGGEGRFGHRDGAGAGERKTGEPDRLQEGQ